MFFDRSSDLTRNLATNAAHSVATLLLAAIAVTACSSTTDTAGANAADGSEGADGGSAISPSDDAGASAATKDAGAQKDGGQKPASDGGSCTPSTYYADTDGDGFGDAKSATSSCTKPSGYVADKTDCDDKSASVHPKATEVCDLVDNDCDGAVDGPACAGFAHAYTGTYTMHTTEKLGASVLHDVTCTGTSALTIDLSRTPVVKGTVTCTYAGSITFFSKTQNGTLEASVLPDGTLTGKRTHQFDETDPGTARTFTFTGAITNGNLAVSRTGASWLPNPMSAQPWDVDFTVAAK